MVTRIGKVSNLNQMEKSVLDSLAMPVLAFSRDGRLVYGNQASRYFWHIQPERLLDISIHQLFGKNSEVEEKLHRVIDNEVSYTMEPYYLDRGEGRPPLMLRVQIDPMSRENQPTTMAVVTFWDQTKRARMENRATEGRLMDSIALMVRRLAHELQNPLSGVKGATQLLSRHLRETPEFGEYPSIILKEIERLERLVKSLLQHGNDQHLSLNAFNLHELLDTVIWFQQNSGRAVRFHRDYDPSLPDMVGDRDNLHQVFLNLIQNAMEASPSDGQVFIRTKMLGPWQVEYIQPEPGRVYFQIEIEDQGRGIVEENQTRLFTPFFTTKKNGNGLGLSISFQIIRAHGGDLRYRTAPGGGAVFCAIIPLMEL